MIPSRNSVVLPWPAAACSWPALATASSRCSPSPGLIRLPTTRPIARATVDMRQEVAERQPADLADPGRAGHRADAEHDGAEDDRLDHHLDERDEAGAERLELQAGVGGHEPDQDAEEHRGDHGDVEVVGPVPRCGPVRRACCLSEPLGLNKNGHCANHWGKKIERRVPSPASVPLRGNPPVRYQRMWTSRSLVLRGPLQVRREDRCHNPGVRPRWNLSVARQVLVLQILVVLVLVVASGALATYDARRDARATATDRAVSVARAVADSPTITAALGERPEPAHPALRRPGPTGRGRRLRDRDVDGPDPLQPPRPGQHRQGVHRRGRRRARGRGVHPAVHRHPRPVDAGRGPGLRVRRQRPGGGDGLGRHHHRLDRQAAAQRPRADRDLGAARARRRAGRDLAGRAPAAPPDARARRGRDHPDVRVLHGGARRGPRGAAAARHRRPGPAGQRRGAPAPGPARRRPRPSARRARPGPGLVRRRSAAPPRPTTSTSQATGSSS